MLKSTGPPNIARGLRRRALWKNLCANGEKSVYIRRPVISTNVSTGYQEAYLNSL